MDMAENKAKKWRTALTVVTFFGLILLVYVSREPIIETLKSLNDIKAWILLFMLFWQIINYHAYTQLYRSIFTILGKKIRYKTMYGIAVELNFVNTVFPSVGVAGFSYSPRGLLSNAAMGKFIEQNFPVNRFEDLKIPFAAVACDLETGSEVVLRDSGDLSFAIRASCAIPGVFVPMIDEQGRSLIDGGAATPMPTKAVRKLGAEIVIAVDVLTCGSSFWGKPSTLVGTFFQSAMLMIRNASKNQHYRADVVIEPQIAHIRPDEIAKRDELMELGEKAALEKIDDIKAILNSKY